IALRCRDGRWCTPRNACSAKKYARRHRFVEGGMAVSAVRVHAGVMRAQYVPLRCFFSSIHNGPSQSVMVVETAATLPHRVGSEGSRGTASNSTKRLGDAFMGVRT